MSFLRQYLSAVQSFTRVPVTGGLAQWMGSGPELTRASTAHLPGVGWLVGIVACVAFALVGLVLPGNPFAPLAAAVLSTVATLVLTGGVHESSLARLADALGGPTGTARALETTRDSRPGTFGVLALLMALLSKVSLLAVLAAQSPVAVLVALLAGHVGSRFWPLLLQGPPRSADAGAGSKPGAARLTRRALCIAAAWALVALALAGLAQGPAFVILSVLASGLAFLWMRRLLERRLQAFGHDALGATQQVCETAFYLGAAVGLNIG